MVTMCPEKPNFMKQKLTTSLLHPAIPEVPESNDPALEIQIRPQWCDSDSMINQGLLQCGGLVSILAFLMFM